MSSKQLWYPESVGELLTTELDALADSTLAVAGTDYDNVSNKFRWADFFLKCNSFGGVPGSGALCELHIFYSFDGTYYADGEEGDAATPDHSGNSHHGVFLLQAKQAVQYQQVLRVKLSPFAFRVGIYNSSGQALGAAGNYLKMYPYNEENQ